MRQLLFAILVLNLAAPGLAATAPGQRAVAPKLCEAAVRAIDAAAAKTMAQGSPGMIVEVARNGQLLFSGTYGTANLEQRKPVTRDTVFKLASITKEFTAATILTLVEEGKLDLERTVDSFVPELPAAAKVRLYDLLIHTSGIPDYAKIRTERKPSQSRKRPRKCLRGS